MGILKIWDNFLGPNGPIWKFTFLESLLNLWLFGINKKDGCFIQFRTPSGPKWQVTVKTILVITFINWSLYSPWPLKVFQPTNQFHCAPTTTLTLLTTKTTPSIATIWTTQTAQALQHSTVVATGHCWQKSCCQQKVQCHLPLVASMWHVVKALSKDPPSSLQISSKIRYRKTKPNGCLRRSNGIPIQCDYQPNQIFWASEAGFNP